MLCGARYFDGAPKRVKENIEDVTCLVLDVDHPATGGAGHGTVPSEETLRSALGGLRAIVYASPSHTEASPRWRVLVPLASPLPPKKHRALVRVLSERLVPGFVGCINVEATGDPCRLGFVSVTKHPEDYKWWAQEGALLDWTQIPLEDESWIDTPLGGLDRQPSWTDRATALQFALKAYASRGHDAVTKGDHRILIIHKCAMELWWQWAADDTDFVMEVLRHVNAQFPEAKSEDDLERKMREAHDRTIGPNRVPQLNGPYGSKREPSNAISRDAIKHHARRLRRSHKPDKARIGTELGRLAEGEPLDEDQAVWKAAFARCAAELARQFNHDSKEKILSHFIPSRKVMVAQVSVGTGTKAELLAKGEAAVTSLIEIDTWIEVALNGEKKRKIEQAKRNDDAMRRAIEAATGGERDTKYTFAEIDTWSAPDGVGLSEKTWLLHSGKVTWVFLNGTWVGPYTESEFDAQGYTDLEAASDFVQTKTWNKDKEVWSYIPLKELLRKYGSKCTPHIDYTCERSFYRAEDRTLVCEGPVRIPLDAKFHVEVDEWLRHMTGRSAPLNESVRRGEASAGFEVDDYDSVCNWLACVTHPEHICAALYLQGPKGLGKGMLADGVAKLWKAGKITLTAAFGDFNSLLAGSYLIHIDEGLPRNMTASVLLRRSLSDREHIYTRKHKDSGKLTGCVRMLFTANNLDIFSDVSKKEQLQKDDVDALGDRFAHIRVRPAAGEYLQGLGPRRGDFVEKNMIAEHTLWLAEKRWTAIKKRDLRFLVEGRNKNVSNVVATNSEAGSDVCNALVAALAGAANGSGMKREEWFAVKNGDLWVNSSLLKTHIAFANPASRYTERDITRAITSVTDVRDVIISGTKRMRMWKYPLDVLKAWCDNTQVRDWDEEVIVGINKLNEA